MTNIDEMGAGPEMDAAVAAAVAYDFSEICTAVARDIVNALNGRLQPTWTMLSKRPKSASPAVAT